MGHARVEGGPVSLDGSTSLDSAVVPMAAPIVIRSYLAPVPDLPPDLPPALLARAVAAWTMLVGTISFELFGHLVGAISDHEAHFTHQMIVVAGQLGLHH